MTTKMRKRKTTREHEVEDNYRPRLHRSVGVYLALKAWTHGIDCIVLSRKELLQFFDMKVTTGDRMELIKMDLKPWFKGFTPSCPRLSRTFVNYLFLGRREKDTAHFKTVSNLRGAKLLIEQINKSDDPGGPKTAFFSQIASEGGVPTQEKLLSELVLLASGLEPPKIKEANKQTTPKQTGFRQIEVLPSKG